LAMRTGHLDIVRAVDRRLRHIRRLERSLRLTKQLLKLTGPKWRRHSTGEPSRIRFFDLPASLVRKPVAAASAHVC
jgi:hypothetical protein